MLPKTRNRLVVLLVLAVPAVIFLFSVLYNASTVPPLAPMPVSNGYNDLTNSVALLVTNVDDYSQLSLSYLELLVSSDSNALQLARIGLQKECRVPVDYSPTSQAMMDRLVGIKRLGLAFAAEARLAQLQGRTPDAAKSYLDLIHLGNESARGGLLIDQLVGDALEKLGTSGLQKLLPQLDAQTCHKTAVALETLDAQRQTWDEVMLQEHNWSHRLSPGIRGEIYLLAAHNMLKQIYQRQERKFEERQIKTRQLIIDLAARAYKLDKGNPPAHISDLVPGYLKAIPLDPFTGTNIVYLPQ